MPWSDEIQTIGPRDRNGVFIVTAVRRDTQTGKVIATAHTYTRDTEMSTKRGRLAILQRLKDRLDREQSEENTRTTIKQALQTELDSIQTAKL